LDRAPLQSSSPPRNRQPLGWTRRPWGFCNLSTTSRVRAPYEAGCPKPTSVPLSGFLNPSAVSWQRRVLRPCFVPLPPVGASFRVFPSQRSWITSRRHQLPGRSPPACSKRAACCPARRFTDHHARAHQPGSPSGSSSLSTSTRRQARPGHSDLTRRNRSRSASFVDFEALLPLRVRSHRRGYLTATAGRDSPGCSAPPELHRRHLEFSDPPRPRDLNTTRPPAEGRATTMRTSQPSQPGEASPPHRSATTRLARQLPDPFGTGLRRLAATPRLPRPQANGREPEHPDPRSVKVCKRRRISKDPPTLLGFLASSKTS
jgi:hypothetical protein